MKMLPIKQLLNNLLHINTLREELLQIVSFSIRQTTSPHLVVDKWLKLNIS